MKFNTQVVTRSVARKVFLAKKNSPHIFFAAGVIGAVGSAVLACRATLKLEEQLDGIKNDVALVRAKTLEESAKTGVYSNDVSYACTSYAAVKTVKVVGRLYGPAILLGGASIAALTGSHIQLARRNAALSATLAMVSKAYNEYRERVQKEIGKERELDIYRNVELKTLKDGSKELVKFVNGHGYSPYAQIFDENSRHWQDAPELNRLWVEVQQNYLNHKLQADGFVFLNDAYESLGIPHTSAGQIVGWLRDGDGDGFVDFGLYLEGTNVGNDLRHGVLLDFNVDGPVYDKI